MSILGLAKAETLELMMARRLILRLAAGREALMVPGEAWMMALETAVEWWRGQARSLSKAEETAPSRGWRWGDMWA